MTRVEDDPSVITPQAASAPSQLAPASPNYSPLAQIVVTRVKEFYRHPASIFWVYVFPILMAIVLGGAFQNTNAEKFQVDVESGPAAESIVAALDAATAQQKGLVFKPRIVSNADARRNLKTARTAVVVVPSSGANSAGAGTTALGQLHVEYLFDPTRPDSVAARRSVDDVLQRAAGRRDSIEIKDARFTEPGGRYIDFLVPGLIGAGLMSGGMWGCGFVVVDLRVRHLLKRFITTPMRKSDFLIGLMVSRFLFMATEVVLMFIATWWLFDVQIFGSKLALAICIVIGCFAFAGMGLVVGSRAQTLETASGVINLVMLPMWLVSGIFFSTSQFPDSAQPLIHILPLTALIDAVRAITIEGAGLSGILYSLAVLIVWTVVCFVVALKSFRWY